MNYSINKLCMWGLIRTYEVNEENTREQAKENELNDWIGWAE